MEQITFTSGKNMDYNIFLSNVFPPNSVKALIQPAGYIEHDGVPRLPSDLLRSFL